MLGYYNFLRGMIMSISALHWGAIVVSVTNHARELYPHDENAQKALVQKLLCIPTEESHKAFIQEVLALDLSTKES